MDNTEIDDDEICDTEIIVEMRGPNGPRVVFPTRATEEEVEAAVPSGWRVNWDISTRVGANYVSPLVERSSYKMHCRECGTYCYGDCQS